MRTYTGWSQVPEHLMTATALGELEFPRTVPDRPTAYVDTTDWRGKKTTVELYDATTAAPTTATAGQLAAAAARATRTRTCADCGAHCQRILTTTSTGLALCPPCWHVVRLREAQAKAVTDRAAAVEKVAQLLDRPNLCVVQVDLTVPPPAPSGRARPATAARVRAVDGTGARLVDVLVRLVGPRAQHVPAGAVDQADAAPLVHQALLDRPLLGWNEHEYPQLHTAAPHADWPRPSDSRGYTAVWQLSTRWRGQLDPRTRRPLVPLPPGTPDRLLLHLQRIAASRDSA